MKKGLVAIVFLSLALLLQQRAIAQTGLTVKGVVKTEEGRTLSKASVLLWYQGERDTIKTVSDEEGRFHFNQVRKKKLAVLVTYVGFRPFLNSYDFSQSDGEQQIWDVVMKPGDNTLQNLTLESSKIQIKEDTVSYVVDSTMYRKNDNVESMLKNLPGVQVDKDGTVTAQGKQVTKVKVNGKEFFGGDVTTATRELNADMVDKIQIIDDYGDQAAFTGIKDGDATKTMNIQLRKDKNKGYFGNATLGAGTEERYQASLSVNRFNDDQQISLLGNLNNNNASLFNFGSFGGGAGSMGNMIGGMVRSFGIGSGGGGIASALGNLGVSDGIARTQSLGLNFRDNWGSKVSVYGSYSFSNRGTNTIREINQQNSFQNQTNTNTRFSNQYEVNENHRFSFNIEYKIDSFNYVKINPGITYRRTNGDYYTINNVFGKTGNKLTDGYIDEFAQYDQPSYSGNILFNHRFRKKGRTLSLNLSAGLSSNDGTDDLVNANTYYINGNSFDTLNQQYITQNNDNRNYGIRASYTEPLSKKRSLEFNYAHNYQFTGNDRETFLVDPASGSKQFTDSLSSIYENEYTTNRFGVNFRTNEKKYNYSIGLAVQPATIRSRSVTGKYSYRQDILNYFPVVRFAYNFSRSRSLNINYSGNTTQPSFSQLQPVPDYSNQLYVTIGNPDLRPEFTNSFNLRYNNFDFISGNVFFGNLLFSFTNDKIVTNTIPVGGLGRQETRYLNSNGFFTASGFYNVSKPIRNRKYVFNLGGTLTYNNNVSYLNSEKNIGRNWLFIQRVATDIRIKKWLETTTGVNFTLNSTQYSLKSASLQNLSAQTWTFSHTTRIFLPRDFIISYDLDKTLNNGYSETVAVNPFIINATLEKQLFKKKNGSIKLQAFDLLNENISINRQVTANSITDTRTNRLGRYFMLSFIIRLNKFSGQTSTGMPPGMGMPGGGMQIMRQGGL
ncbi:MAG: outer membrane beta-barrel family protein [Ferruginibacter sp.]